MDHFCGRMQREAEPILKMDSECIPIEIPHDFSVDPFPFELDQDFNTDGIQYIRTICHSAATTQTTSSFILQCPRSPSYAGTESSATCPSGFPSDPNDEPVSPFNQLSHRMITMMEKLNDKIDGNATDLAKVLADYSGRTRDLERRVKLIQDEQQEMRRQILATAQQQAAVPVPNPVTPENEPTAVAPAGQRRRPCVICGKVLSVPYVYTHQKQVHRK